MKDIPVQKKGMQFPDYDNLEVRKNSFSLLPTELPNWKQYAKEGFFVTEDLIMVCFYCDLPFFNLSNIDKRFDLHRKECLFAKSYLIKTEEVNEPKNACLICMSREVVFQFLPCSHLVTCEKCCYKFHNCFVCRGKIDKVRIVFL